MRAPSANEGTLATVQWSKTLKRWSKALNFSPDNSRFSPITTCLHQNYYRSLPIFGLMVFVFTNNYKFAPKLLQISTNFGVDGGVVDPLGERRHLDHLAHKKHPPPEDHHRSLGIGLL